MVELGAVKVKVVESPTTPAFVPTTVVSAAHVLLMPLWRVTGYGGAPPDQVTVAVTVGVIPVVVVEGERVRVGAESVGLTIMVEAAQETAAGVPVLLSVTRTEYVVVVTMTPGE